YINHLLQFVDVEKIKPFTILADAGNGVGGLPAHRLFAAMPQLKVTELYFEPDGRFPNHEANPFERENIEELIRRIRAENADFGGEVSGHYYFREHYYADNGFIPLLSILQMLSEENVTLRQLVASLGEYYISGEINSTVPDTNAVLERIKAKYADGRQ